VALATGRTEEEEESQQNNKNVSFTLTCNLTGAAQINFETLVK